MKGPNKRIEIELKVKEEKDKGKYNTGNKETSTEDSGKKDLQEKEKIQGKKIHGKTLQKDKVLCILIMRTGVDFIKVGRKARNIVTALSKLGAGRKARSTPLKSFSKVGRRAQIRRKTVMKSTPGLISTPICMHKI